jgi:hypothetical protein
MCTYEERKITREKFCLSWKFALLRPERIQRSANILYTSKAETGVGGGNVENLYSLFSAHPGGGLFSSTECILTQRKAKWI